MQSPPFPRYLVPPRSKYSPQYHVPKYPLLLFLPQCQRPSFTPIQNNRQDYSSIYLDLYIFGKQPGRQKRTCHLQNVTVAGSEQHDSTSALGSNAQAVLTDQKSGEFHCRVWQENLKKLNYKRTKTQVSCTTKDNVSTHCPDFRYSAPKTPAPVPKAEVEAAPAQLHTRNNTSVRYSLLHATMGYSDSNNSCQSRSFHNKTRWISFIYSKNFKISINRNIFMPVFFLYGCETWSFMLKDERRPRVFENRALRRIFGPKRH
jgi:hypothetical protein